MVQGAYGLGVEYYASIETSSQLLTDMADAQQNTQPDSGPEHSRWHLLRRAALFCAIVLCVLVLLYFGTAGFAMAWQFKIDGDSGTLVSDSPWVAYCGPANLLAKQSLWYNRLVNWQLYTILFRATDTQ